MCHSRCSFCLGGEGLEGCTSISARTESIVPSLAIAFSVDLEALRGLVLQVSTNEGKCRAGSISWQVPSGFYTIVFPRQPAG